jgi:hypothetical protein
MTSSWYEEAMKPNTSFHQSRPDEYKWISCSQESCTAKIANHAHGKIRAGEDGWFFQKSGEAWCPLHHPEWVAAWRERKAKK